jgi:hypothetical protein
MPAKSLFAPLVAAVPLVESSGLTADTPESPATAPIALMGDDMMISPSRG